MREVSNLIIWLLLISILLLSSSGVVFSTNTNGTNRFISEGIQNMNTPKVKIVASFFPVYEFVRKIGGDKVDASVLVPIGAEPHDLIPLFNKFRMHNLLAVSIQWSRNGSNMDKQS